MPDTLALLRRNETTITRYFEEVWNQGRVDVLDELLTPDYLNHSPGLPDPRPGPEDLKPIVLAMRAGITGLHCEILDLVLAPDKAAVHLRVTGRHTGPLFGMMPAGSGGAAIDVRQMQIEHLREGRIAAHWRLTDDLNLLRQIGQR